MDRQAKAKGGHARAAALSPERRRAIAREAAKARWEKPCMSQFIATVRIIVDADELADATTTIAEIMGDNHRAADWAYMTEDGHFTAPRLVQAGHRGDLERAWTEATKSYLERPVELSMNVDEARETISNARQFGNHALADKLERQLQEFLR